MENIDNGAVESHAHHFYKAAWRWHFYAGIAVVPFLIILAATGLIMLWITAYGGLNGDRMAVPVTGEALAISAQYEAVMKAYPDARITDYVEPRAAGRVSAFIVETADAETTVLLNPYTGEMLDQFAAADSWYAWASDLHGTLLIGDIGDRIIEIAAGFSIMLLITGLYMWWPRGGVRFATVLIPNLRAKGRAFWRSIHMVSGFWISAVLLVFLISGLSWAGIWGGKFVQAWSSFPAEKWGVPLSEATHADMDHGGAHDVPWALEQVPMPQSGSDSGAASPMGASSLTMDDIGNYARNLGFDGRFWIRYPQTDSAVWTISHDSMSNDGPIPWQDRTLHIDQHSGNILADVGFADYAPYAKFMAVGISFHQGTMGLWNLALNTVFCLMTIFVGLSGIVMWWKRRPAGARRLAAPPMPSNLPLWKGAVFLGLFVSMAFPLVGITLLAVLILDLLVISRLPALRRLLS